MRLVFRPEAQKENLSAQAWYEDRASGLGIEFARAVDLAVGRIRRTPTAFDWLETQYRQLMLRKFPYSIIYMSQMQKSLSCLAFIIGASLPPGCAV